MKIRGSTLIALDIVAATAVVWWWAIAGIGWQIGLAAAVTFVVVFCIGAVKLDQETKQ